MNYIYFIITISDLRFDGRAIDKLKSPGRLIPIGSKVASKLSTPPTILRRGKHRRKVSSFLAALYFRFVC